MLMLQLSPPLLPQARHLIVQLHLLRGWPENNHDEDEQQEDHQQGKENVGEAFPKLPAHMAPKSMEIGISCSNRLGNNSQHMSMSGYEFSNLCFMSSGYQDGVSKTTAAWCFGTWH